MLDIGSVPTCEDPHRSAIHGVGSQLAQGCSDPATAPSACLLLRQEGHRPVDPDFEDLIHPLKVGIDPGVLHEGAVAADAGQDHAAILGMVSHLPGQAKEPQALLQVHGLGRPALGQGGALRLFLLAQLDEGTKPP